MFSDNQLNIANDREIQAFSESEYLLRVKPLVDIYETEDEMIVRLEMPGVGKENLQVQIKDGYLHISGRRNNSKVPGQYLLRETRDVLFERIFELEDNLDTQKITANYRYGILTITIGKKEEAKPRTIKIN
ncbi:MAG: hypothetical protein Kow0042_06910 [Calditrichia bacterium]